MKAKEFIEEKLLEYGFMDRLRAGKKLHTASILFQKLLLKFDDPHEAANEAAKLAGVSPRLLQDYLKDANLLESVMLNEKYIAFELDKKSRRQLAKVFEPKYPDFIGHHVTYKFGVDKDAKLPFPPKKMEVIGYVDDGEGLEALVVAINGSSERSDGNTYHITWSLDREKGKKPVHSNDLIAMKGYKKVTPVEIKAKPKLLG